MREIVLEKIIALQFGISDKFISNGRIVDEDKLRKRRKLIFLVENFRNIKYNKNLYQMFCTTYSLIKIIFNISFILTI